MYRRKSVGKVSRREKGTQGGSRMGRGEAVELESQLPGPGMVETQTDDGGEEQIEGASDWLLASTRGDWGPGSVTTSSPPRSLQSSSSLTFLVRPSTYLLNLNVPFLSPVVFSQVLSSSLCLAYAAFPPTR